MKSAQPAALFTTPGGSRFDPWSAFARGKVRHQVEKRNFESSRDPLKHRDIAGLEAAFDFRQETLRNPGSLRQIRLGHAALLAPECERCPRGKQFIDLGLVKCFLIPCNRFPGNRCIGRIFIGCDKQPIVSFRERITMSSPFGVLVMTGMDGSYA